MLTYLRGRALACTLRQREETKKNKPETITEFPLSIFTHETLCWRGISYGPVSVCSVRLSHAGIISKRLSRSSSVLAHMLNPAYVPTLCYKGIRVSPKIRVLPFGNLSQTLDLSSVHTIPVFTGRVGHAGDTAREHGCMPWARPVSTGSVYGAVEKSLHDVNKTCTHNDFTIHRGLIKYNDTRNVGQCPT